MQPGANERAGSSSGRIYSSWVPAVRAGDLFAEAGYPDMLSFKRDVRRLKELGLTESLTVGYRLSPRGAAVLSALS